MKHILIILIIWLFSLYGKAQPSGGPYGPVKMNYELPKVSGTIYYVSPNGKADQKGESVNNPTSIEEAFKRVKSGDAIILRGGIYRTGNLVLNQGITMQPYADEQPVLKGTLVASEWTDLRNGLWVTKWSRLFPSKPADWWVRDRNGKQTPLHRFNDDMVFVDGKFLQSAGWEGEVDENSFFIDYETGKVYIGTDPKNKLVEITAYNVALDRVTGEVNGTASDKKGPVIRGIVFTQYAYRAIEIHGTEPEGLSDESKYGKDVTGTVLENCEISYCSRVAGYFRGDHMIIRNCKVSNTSTEGIYVLSSSDVLLEKNIFTANNIERITGYYPAAVKIFNQCYRVTCRDNLVIDLPYSNGIWYDVGNVDGVFVNNRVENVGLRESIFTKERPWPSQNGFFFEISKGAICAGNVFVNCEQGVFILNSSNVQMYQNTFINSTACISRNERSAAGDHFGWHPSTGPDVDKREGHVFVNNVMASQEGHGRPLLFVWQPPAMCNQLEKSPLKQVDFNLYIQWNEKSNIKPILWSPAKNDSCFVSFHSPAEFHNMFSEFAGNSGMISGNNASVFKSLYLGNYQLISGKNVIKGAVLPENIRTLLGLSKKYVPYVGAFPGN